MTPTLEARLAEVLPHCICACGATNSRREHDGACCDCRGEPADLDDLRPAVLTLLRTLLREERERCAEVALRRVAPDSPDHVAADCTECHDGLMLARDIRALEDRND